MNNTNADAKTQRPTARAVLRAFRKYLTQVVAKAPGDEKELAQNIIDVQTMAAKFDELDARIWGDK